MKNNIKEYLEYHKACKGGLEWCVENCTDMEDVWNNLKHHSWMLWLVSDAKCLTNTECHEFGLWCVEQVRHLMTDDRSTRALDVKRDWLDGKATDSELQVARKAASAAASAAVRSAAGEEARCVARAAAWSVECIAASAAGVAAGGAAWEAAYAVAGVGARKAVKRDQLKWLRANTTPVFEIEGT